MKILIFDTETTGLPKSREPAIKGENNWPHMVSIAWTVIDSDRDYKPCAQSESYIVKPRWTIPEDSTKIHGITQEQAETEGFPLSTIMEKFLAVEHDIMVAHNMNFDYNVLVNAILWDLKLVVLPDFKPTFCSMEAMKNIMKIPAANGRGFKSPKLTELYTYAVKRPFDSGLTHSAQYDTWLLADIIKHSTYLQEAISLSAPYDPNPNAPKKARTTLIL
jgi:DNA polymerase III epsilon subunit-like protein